MDRADVGRIPGSRRYGPAEGDAMIRRLGEVPGMEIGIGLDSTLGLTYLEYCQMAREAVELGYESAWTHAGVGRDAFQICGQWNAATRDQVADGVGTGISV